MEKLVLAQEYLAEQQQANPPQTAQPPRRNNRMNNAVPGQTTAAALIALGLVLAALILRGLRGSGIELRRVCDQWLYGRDLAMH